MNDRRQVLQEREGMQWVTKKLPRIRDIAERLIDEHHPHLRDAKEGEIPIVAFRGNREKWKVCMDAEDWFKIYREWE